MEAVMREKTLVTSYLETSQTRKPGSLVRPTQKRKKIENKKIFLEIVLFSIYGFPEKRKYFVGVRCSRKPKDEGWAGGKFLRIRPRFEIR